MYRFVFILLHLSFFWIWKLYMNNNFTSWKSKLQGFWYFVRLRSHEIQVNPWNPAKFTKTHKIPWKSVEILSNTCLYSNFETCLSYWGYLLAVNSQIYVKTSSLKRANNAPKSVVFSPIAFWPSLPRKFLWNRPIFQRFCP